MLPCNTGNYLIKHQSERHIIMRDIECNIHKIFCYIIVIKGNNQLIRQIDFSLT